MNQSLDFMEDYYRPSMDTIRGLPSQAHKKSKKSFKDFFNNLKLSNRLGFSKLDMPKLEMPKLLKKKSKYNQSLPEMQFPPPEKGHFRVNSLRPERSVPLPTPPAPRNRHARRPTGPRDLAATTQSENEAPKTEDIKATQSKLIQEVDSLVSLVAAYGARHDERLETAIKIKLADVKAVYSQLETDVNAMFGDSRSLKSKKSMELKSQKSQDLDINTPTKDDATLYQSRSGTMSSSGSREFLKTLTMKLDQLGDKHKERGSKQSCY